MEPCFRAPLRHCLLLPVQGPGRARGSLLAGDGETIRRAHRFRKMLGGGGMRQAGVIAAAGLYALENNIPDIVEDHRRAREFRRALEVEGVRFALPSPTNILGIETADAAAATRARSANGACWRGPSPAASAPRPTGT